ncbi:MAG TPA: hypothetical protein VNX21_06645, partial [Candidatus Thermoplasmatota archaeon]|nr:hypothetical protein [Candidatus Thermoplasmatota archaeon]
GMEVRVREAVAPGVWRTLAVFRDHPSWSATLGPYAFRFQHAEGEAFFAVGDVITVTRAGWTDGDALNVSLYDPWAGADVSEQAPAFPSRETRALRAVQRALDGFWDPRGRFFGDAEVLGYDAASGGASVAFRRAHPLFVNETTTRPDGTRASAWCHPDWSFRVTREGDGPVVRAAAAPGSCAVGAPPGLPASVRGLAVVSLSQGSAPAVVLEGGGTRVVATLDAALARVVRLEAEQGGASFAADLLHGARPMDVGVPPRWDVDETAG